MARLASHAVAHEETRAALRCGGRMATETGRRCCRVAQPERRGNLSRARARQDREGAAVRAALRRCFLPSRKLVLPHHLAIGFEPPVARRPAATGDALKDAGPRAGRVRDRALGPRDRHQQGDRREPGGEGARKGSTLRPDLAIPPRHTSCPHNRLPRIVPEARHPRYCPVRIRGPGRGRGVAAARSPHSAGIGR